MSTSASKLAPRIAPMGSGQSTDIVLSSENNLAPRTHRSGGCLSCFAGQCAVVSPSGTN